MSNILSMNNNQDMTLTEVQNGEISSSVTYLRSGEGLSTNAGDSATRGVDSFEEQPVFGETKLDGKVLFSFNMGESLYAQVGSELTSHESKKIDQQEFEIADTSVEQRQPETTNAGETTSDSTRLQNMGQDSDSFNEAVNSTSQIVDSEDSIGYEGDDTTYTLNDISRTAGMSYETNPVMNQFNTEHSLKYPCVYINTKETGLRRHQLQALSALVKSEVSAIRYSLYIESSGSINSIGSIDSLSLRSLLCNPVFTSWEITIRTDSSSIYEGDMCLAFVTAV